MKTETMSLRRLTLIGIYVLLIFSILALIRSQNHRLFSTETHSTSVKATPVVNLVA